jgi:hypothetical protein
MSAIKSGVTHTTNASASGGLSILSDSSLSEESDKLIRLCDLRELCERPELLVSSSDPVFDPELRPKGATPKGSGRENFFSGKEMT